MNYEEFYQNLQQVEKAFKDRMTQTQRSFRNITKDSAEGDIKKLVKDITEIRNQLNELGLLTAELTELTEGFDAQAYMENGDFARQMIEYCKQYSVDVKGESPSYDIFPYKVRIDAANQDLYVNRRKVPCARPLHFVQKLSQNLGKYTKSSFNLPQFISELAYAYDMAVIVKNSKGKSPREEFELLLNDLYKYLAPTQKARREYDMQNYAFDLARLYASEINEVKDGRKFVFGPSKVSNKLIRILDQNGTERFLGTIRFYE